MIMMRIPMIPEMMMMIRIVVDDDDDDDDKNCGSADDYQLISTSNCRQQPLHSKSFFNFPFLQFFKAR